MFRKKIIKLHVCILTALIITTINIHAQTGTTSHKVTPLLPHKAVYDLTLLKSTGARGVDGARGRIVFEFSGDACEGYTLNFRQVTELTSSETGARTSDLRTTTFEEGEGKAFQVKSDSIINNTTQKVVDVTAERRQDAVMVNITKPKRDKKTLSKNVIFPTEHLKNIISAAKRGDTTYGVQVYDGSDDGLKVYDTLSIIGKIIPAGNHEGLEKAAQNSALTSVARWPVAISYFEPGQGERTPIYILSFDLYEHGVSRNLKLDYNDFALKGEMTTLETLKTTSSCEK